MDYAPLIDRKRQRFAELEAQIASPEFFSDPKKAADSTREHARLRKLLDTWDAFTRTRTELAENQEMARGPDPDFAAMAATEIPALEQQLAALNEQVIYALLPPDGTEDRGSNPNVLTRDIGSSELGQGCAAQSCLIDIARDTAAPRPVRSFAPPAIARA